MITIANIPSAFNPTVNHVREMDYTGGPVYEYIQDLIEKPVSGNISFAVAVNGQDITDQDFKTYLLKDGDIVAVCAQPGAELSTFIAASIASSMTAATVTSAATAFAAGMAVGAVYVAAYVGTMFVIGYGLSMLVSALGLTPDQPDYDTEDTYSWGTLQQTYAEGTGIPYIYGTVRVAGQVINQYKEVNEDSEETLNVQYAICDHAVDLIDGITDIEINNCPTSYFNGIATDTRVGSLDDSVMGKFGEVHNIINIGSELDQDEEDVRDTNGEVEKIIITVTMPYGLYRTTSSGGLADQTAEISVYYRIKTEAGTEPWTHHSDESYTDNITEAIIKTVTIDDLNLNEYEIKIVRTNEKNTSFKARNRIDWTSIDGIVKQELCYPGIAKYSVSALATNQLSGSMIATALVSNSTVSVFDPDADSGAGAYFDADATNFAWMCYDLIVWKAGKGHERILYDEFSEWAAFCETEGYKGGVLIQTGNFWEQVQSIAVLGQAAVLHRGGKYGVFMDTACETISHEFTPDNVLEQAQIQYLPMEDRANFIELEYTDPDRDYTRQVISVKTAEYDQDTNANAQKTTMQLNAVISRDTAKKIGDNVLFSNVYLDKTISLKAHVNSFAAVVGDLFRWKTPKEEHDFIATGTVTNINGTTITISDSVDLPDTGNTYKIAVWSPETTTPADCVISTRGAGTQLVIDTTLDDEYLSGAFSIVEVLYEDEYESEIYRLTHCTKDDDLTREITGLIYKPEIYSSTSGDLPAPVYDNARQEAVSVVLDELLRYDQSGSYISHVMVSWHRSYSMTGSNWNVFIKNNTTNTITLAGKTTNMTFTISEDLVVGESYTVYVTPPDLGAVDTGGNTATITLQGVLAPPSDIENFQAVWDSLHRTVHFAWTEIEDIDLDYYEIREGDQWELEDGDPLEATGTVVVKKPAAVFPSIFIPTSVADGTEKTYWIKAIDKAGVESENVAFETITINGGEADSNKTVPDNLTLTTEKITNSSGDEVIKLYAAWDINAELDTTFGWYELRLTQYINDQDINRVFGVESQVNRYDWDVLPSQEYGVQVRAAFEGGQVSEWSTEQKLVSVGDETAPEDPDTLYLTQFASCLRLKWDHSGETDLDHFKVYRNTTDSFSTATVIETAGSISAGSDWAYHNDTPPEIGKLYYYWVTAVDTSSNESGESNVASGAYNPTEVKQLIADYIEAIRITAEMVDVVTLDAVSAVMGILTAGKIQNTEVGITPTSYWDVDNDIFNLGGELYWDGEKLYIGGTPSDQFGESTTRIYSWTGEEDLTDNLSDSKFELTFDNTTDSATGQISLYLNPTSESVSIDKSKVHIEINGVEVEYLNNE